MMTNTCFVLGFCVLKDKNKTNSISYAFALKMLKENRDTGHVGYRSPCVRWILLGSQH